jgi:hypothetical protein
LKRGRKIELSPQESERSADVVSVPNAANTLSVLSLIASDVADAKEEVALDDALTSAVELVAVQSLEVEIGEAVEALLAA